MLVLVVFVCVFFQAEDGIRYLVRSRGLGDVYKRQISNRSSVRRTLDVTGYAEVVLAPADSDLMQPIFSLSLIHI